VSGGHFPRNNEAFLSLTDQEHFRSSLQSLLDQRSDWESDQPAGTARHTKLFDYQVLISYGATSRTSVG
jgi:hypothetical protein